MKKNIIIYLFSTAFLIFLSMFCSNLSLDRIYCYGFSSNLAKGLIPYRDFSMIIGPFYNLFFSCFLKIFGNSLFIFQIAHSMIYAIVVTLLFSKVGKKCFLLLLLLTLAPTMYGYNTFCAFLVIGILLLQDSDYKRKNFWIGILMGIIFMTKQNVGIGLIFIFLFTTSKRKEAILGFLVPVIFILIYLSYHHILSSYLDYCYLGLGSFWDNAHFDFFSCFLFFLSSYWLIKQIRKERKLSYIYSFLFLLLAFPIMDFNHIVPAIIPVFYQFLLEGKTLWKNYLQLFVLLGFLITQITTFSSSHLILENQFLKYQRIPDSISTYLSFYSNYLDQYSHENVYLFLENSYLIRLYRNETINLYDLINQGNFGGREEQILNTLEKKCQQEKCVFFLDHLYFQKKKTYNQLSTKFYNWVLENAQYVETLPSNDQVYKN